MKKRLRNFLRSPAHVLYPLGVLVLLGTMVLSFAADSLAYALGILHEQTITLDDAALYTLVNMERTDAQTLTAVNGDAQLLLQPGQRVRTLRLAAQYPAGLSCEMDLYWHLPGGGYTAARRIWPTVCADGAGWNYTLPWLAGQNLRLDLADQGGAAVRSAPSCSMSAFRGIGILSRRAASSWRWLRCRGCWPAWPRFCGTPLNSLAASARKGT